MIEASRDYKRFLPRSNYLNVISLNFVESISEMRKFLITVKDDIYNGDDTWFSTWIEISFFISFYLSYLATLIFFSFLVPELSIVSLCVDSIFRVNSIRLGLTLQTCFVFYMYIYIYIFSSSFFFITRWFPVKNH